MPERIDSGAMAAVPLDMRERLEFCDLPDELAPPFPP